MCFSSGSFTNRMSCCLLSCTERHLKCCHYAYVITRREFGFETACSVLLHLTTCPAFTQVLFSRYADLV